ncbi:MAG: hypothetical protein AB8G99_02975 [Planctomycetaceae bacterium]
MSISVKCPHGHKLVLRDEHAGKKVRCPKCQVVMRAPKGRWDVAPTLREAKSVRRPVFMCAGGHRFLVLSDHESESVKCPLCDQPAGVPVNATLLNANGQTIVAEAPGLELSAPVGQPMPLTTAGTATLLAPPVPSDAIAETPVQSVEEAIAPLQNPYAVPEVGPAPAPNPNLTVVKERIWPLYVLVGGAAATLVGIAFYLKHTAVQ